MSARKAMITGITGQDGCYLAEFLLEKGYEVHGLVRRSSSFNTWRIDHVRDRLVLHYGDLVDQNSLVRTIGQIGPDEVYNLAAQSHVKVTLRDAGVHRGRHRPRRAAPARRGARAGHQGARLPGRQLGDVRPRPGDAADGEDARSIPRSPYGVAKVFGHWMTINYRESYGIHACNGILFNHESPRRGENFVTRKITMGAGRDQEGDEQGAAPRATSTPSATGATRGTTSRRCGSCCSRSSPTTT